MFISVYGLFKEFNEIIHFLISFHTGPFSQTCKGRKIIYLKKLNLCQTQKYQNVFRFFVNHNAINEESRSVSLGVVSYIGVF